MKAVHVHLRHALVVGLTALSVAPAAAKPPPPRPPMPKVVQRWRRPPDPRPLVTAEYLELALARSQRGELKLLKLARGAFAKPQAILPRFRGRFEAKLYGAGGSLLDVVRFNFPLTAASDGEHPQIDPLGVGLGRGASARTRVRVPFDATVSALVIRDSVGGGLTKIDLSPVVRRAPPARPPALDEKLRTGTFRKP
jgi:hypothetical protein